MKIQSKLFSLLVVAACISFSAMGQTQQAAAPATPISAEAKAKSDADVNKKAAVIG